MTSCWRAIVAVAIAAVAAVAQDTAQLGRIRAHLHDELARVPNYTCLETVTRFRKDARSRVWRERVLGLLDIVRLEIVYADHREWYGSPGERRLTETNPSKYVGGGMMAKGAFAGTLNNIVSAGEMTYAGEEEVSGRPAVRYDFHLARSLGALVINVLGAQGTVGQEGSLWIDPRSLDLIRMEAQVAEIPPHLPLIAA